MACHPRLQTPPIGGCVGVFKPNFISSIQILAARNSLLLRKNLHPPPGFNIRRVLWFLVGGCPPPPTTPSPEVGVPHLQGVRVLRTPPKRSNFSINFGNFGKGLSRKFPSGTWQKFSTRCFTAGQKSVTLWCPTPTLLTGGGGLPHPPPDLVSNPAPLNLQFLWL